MQLSLTQDEVNQIVKKRSNETMVLNMMLCVIL